MQGHGTSDRQFKVLIGKQTWGIKPEIAQIDLISVLEDGSSTPITVEAVKGGRGFI